MQFEPLAGEWFRLQGYGVVETSGSGPEGGMDPVLIKGARPSLKCVHAANDWEALIQIALRLR